MVNVSWINVSIFSSIGIGCVVNTATGNVGDSRDS
jgi:hypothetical protein